MRYVSFSLLVGLVLSAGVANAIPNNLSYESNEINTLEQNGLRISLSSYHGSLSQSNLIELGKVNPTILVALQNTTNEPLNVWDQSCSLGNGSLTLEINRIDGRDLAQPIVVERQNGAWWANGAWIETIDGHDTIVRQVILLMTPDVIKNSTVPVQQTPHRINESYSHFPFPNSSAPVRLRMRAVFRNPATDADKKGGVWTGRIATPWKEYLVSW